MSLVASALLAVTAAGAADWPSFRGAAGDGSAIETGLARSWNADGPAELWRRSIGDGYSGLTVVGERLFTTERRDGTQRAVALKASTGETLWSYDFGTDYQDASGFGDGARSTPAVDGDTVFVVSADAVLVVLDAQTGELRRRVDFKEAFKTKQPRFGFGASPVVFGDTVVIEAGGPEGHSLVAFDMKDGALRWSVLDDPAGYATPLVATVAGTPQLIFNRRSGLVGLDATSGAVLWTHPSAMDTLVMPLALGDDRFLISSAAMGDGAHVVRVRRGESGFSAEPVWSNPRFRNHFSNAVAVGGQIYGFDNATLRCLDAADGKARWAHRGFGKGSLIAADGLLFVLGDQGLLALVEATPEAYRELGRVQALPGRSWTAPSLAGGRLFVRDHDELAAFDVRASGARAPAVGEAKVAAQADGKTELPKSAAEVVARYVAARGGAERWARLQALELSGRYSAFSRTAPFTERHQRSTDGDRFRLDFESLGGPVTWARDGEGLWWTFPLIGVETPRRLLDDPGKAYSAQLHRRAEMVPLLLQARDLKVSLGGIEEVGGRRAVVLEVEIPGGGNETWYLDPESWLEIAVDSTVHDFSQMGEPMTQRTFLADFRAVDGLMIPHRVAVEFGARLEEIEVDSIRVNPQLDDALFKMPKQPAGDEETPKP